MSRLLELSAQQDQSPWLDNLRRGWLRDGTLTSWVSRGVRGLTSNPSIFQKAIAEGAEYDDQLAERLAAGDDVTAAYWALVLDDIRGACDVLAPVHAESEGRDGYVSVEVDPHLAHDTDGTLRAARDLHATLARPNLYVKVPGTAAGVPAVRTLISEGHSVNVTLLFSLSRYDEVIEAYLSGLEACAGDLSGVSSVASFFVSRLDAAVDPMLRAAGRDDLTGRTAVANAQAAYALFTERFSGPRWEALVARGARPQRPLWASTSTKDPTLPDTLYVDTLIGPDTVNTMPDATLAAFEDHGTVARTVDADLRGARAHLDAVAGAGVDLDAVTDQLEVDGVAAFITAFDDLLATLAAKAGVAPPP